jgi:hypothetical protein
MSSEQDHKQKKPPPSYSGNAMPDNVCLTSNDGGEEVTRRVGAHMSSLQPSFEPMTSFEPLSLSRFGQPAMNSSINTQPGKLQVKPSERVRERPSDKGRWNLVDVPTLPQFHPLERTAVLVPHATASEVSVRISDVLRDRSIEAFYEDDKAKVKCTTPEGVNFRVRLYRGRGEFNHGIIVEVQRRFGVSVNFHGDTVAILDAAQGNVPPPPPPPSFTSGNIPMVSDSEDDFETDGISSLAMVSTMLKHPGYDSHYLALQTLSSLTDSSKMGASTARKVSLELLKPDNEVGSKILALVVDKKDDDFMFKLQVMAFSVLANAIQAVDGVVSGIVREHLRPVLLEALHQAESNPRSAQMAARCVEFLMDGDHDIGDLHGALETALESGKARHAGLMRQAQVCLDKINGGELR